MRGAELKRLRAAADKTQPEACALFDYSLRQWQAFEAGDAEIPLLLERAVRVEWGNLMKEEKQS